MLGRIVCTLILALIVGIATPRPGAALSGYALSGPLSYENLSVYFVRGPSSNAPAPLTVQEASAKGLVRIREMSTGSPMLDNLSGKPLFVPFGTLLTGGLQDQVVASSLFVGPGATGIALPVFCVERGRSVKRQGDDESTFGIADALIPSRIAKLAVLSGGSQSRAAVYVRQIGVWLSVASVKQGFTAQLDDSIQSPRSATSLPLALEHPGVSLVQSPYLEALASALPPGKDVVGAVFAINGNLSSAEIYGSHALFSKMWPSLLRAHAGEAAIARGLPSAELPSRAATLAFIINGDRAVADARRTATVVRIDSHAPFAKAENESGVFAAAQSDKRGWSHKSFVAKAELGATPMESAVLRALADNLVDTTFSRLAPAVEVQQLASWLAQMSGDPQGAMRQAAAARIIEPRPGDHVSAPAYAPLNDHSSDTKMALLAIALCGVLGRIIFPLLAKGMRRIGAAMHAPVLQLRTAGAQLAAALRAVPAACAAFIFGALPSPGMRVDYATARRR
jgi:hypothetical protein